VHAVRRDVADIALADWIFAPHYALAHPQAVSLPFATIFTAPQREAAAGSQLFFGEAFHVLDIAGGWAWGFCGHDHYVGYIAANAIAAPISPTHFISVREAPLFSSASIKAPVAMTLSLGARVEGTMAGDFLETSRGFVHRRHILPVDTRLEDTVATAGMLLGAPYLWGGRGSGGADCSGLVQIALTLAGYPCPRDSDQQQAEIGRGLAPDEPYARGDLIFFPGHVGLMVDGNRLLHANAWWMSTVIEPLEDVLARLRPQHETPLLCARRLAS
jgi:cell wall-associated NlpC family hydrolase